VVTIVGPQVAAAEGEQVVKTYHCTSFKSRLLGVAAEGFLEVTNKRVMLQATSRGSLIHSEVPIQDVSGLSLFKGNHFSLKHFVAVLLLGAVVGSIVSGLLSGFCSWAEDEYAVTAYIVGIALAVWASHSGARDIKKPVLAGAASSALVCAGGIGLAVGSVGYFYGDGGQSTLGILGMIAGFGAGIWALVLMVKYSIRPTMTLAVNSKGGLNTPIAIAGPGLGPAGSGAARALEAEPAEDAEQMVKELGALILDIQERGDLGLEKWRLMPAGDRR